MKRILITGIKSYVGTNLEAWLNRYPEKYDVRMISVREKQWIQEDFSIYDVIIHVAGIVHKKDSIINSKIFYKINRDLTFELAKKSKDEGIKQFVYLSSMSVYGIDTGEINKETPLEPKTHYGKSKLQAEQLLETLTDDKFVVSIIRPPMVYGNKCNGNYKKLSKLATLTPVFPRVSNRRSMIFINNLCEFIRLVVDDEAGGIFCPQNDEYVCTSDMVEKIATIHSKKIFLTNLFNRFLLTSKNQLIKKLFGDLVYDKELSKYKSNYCVTSYIESVRLSEVGKNGAVKAKD